MKQVKFELNLCLFNIVMTDILTSCRLNYITASGCAHIPQSGMQAMWSVVMVRLGVTYKRIDVWLAYYILSRLWF